MDVDSHNSALHDVELVLDGQYTMMSDLKKKKCWVKKTHELFDKLGAIKFRIKPKNRFKNKKNKIENPKNINNILVQNDYYYRADSQIRKFVNS